MGNLVCGNFKSSSSDEYDNESGSDPDNESNHAESDNDESNN